MEGTVLLYQRPTLPGTFLIIIRCMPPPHPDQIPFKPTQACYPGLSLWKGNEACFTCSDKRKDSQPMILHAIPRL
uniref:Uncharacterized protein n=1 Tax=Picea glauca TaxID=3330 RepID=A0A124GNX3_PICGL|nr:hypothetical protein ABT39_MTgene26 [Picea glauca]QHR89346.1 hypothetical protein Q903MT_gene3367 [Picea sitchensis]